MPRTIEEILQQADQAQQRIQEIHALITEEVNADANLAGLDSPSKVAEFKLWKEAFSALSLIMEQLWEEAQVELKRLATEGISANAAWFAREFKKFQFGDTLLFDDANARYFYAAIDETKQIIKRLTIVRNAIWELKVATEDAGGNPIPLSADQLNAFKAYVERLQPPGPAFQITSIPSDKLDARFEIYYDPIIPIVDLQPLIEAAYLSYVAQIDIEGESIYYITRHIDAMQAVENVIDIKITSIEARTETGPYAIVDRIYTPISGYLEKDPDLDFSVLLTYIQA